MANPRRVIQWLLVMLSLGLLSQAASAARQQLVVFYDQTYSTRYGGDPEQIAALRLLSGPAKLARGQTGQFAFSLTAAGGQAVRGLVPAEVRVYGPDGQEAWEYGAQTLIRDGVVCLPLPLARNDTPGAWRVVLRELASSRTAEARVTVTP